MSVPRASPLEDKQLAGYVQRRTNIMFHHLRRLSDPKRKKWALSQLRSPSYSELMELDDLIFLAKKVPVNDPEFQDVFVCAGSVCSTWLGCGCSG